MTHTESNVIRILRVSAMLSIVLCHFMQAYGIALKSVFNIGVQAFFVLSGFLYGNKNVDNMRVFYKKRIEKIYIPYLILFLIMLPLWFFVAHKSYSILTIIAYGLNLGGGGVIYLIICGLMAFNILGF